MTSLPKAMELELARVRAVMFEPYTLFRVRPMAGRYVNVTTPGFRSGGSVAVWPPDKQVMNLFVFGGSTTFGYGVADTETIPAQLADQCARLFPGQRIAVYNFASPYYISVQERIRLEQLLLEGYTPCVAIFIDGFDEFIAPYYAPLMLKPFVEALQPRATLRQGARTLQGLVYRLTPQWLRSRYHASWLAGHPPGPSPDPVAVVDRYVANTRLINAICEHFGVQPLFVWQPVPCYQYAGATQQPHAAAESDSAPLLACVRSGYHLMNMRRAEISSKTFLWLADMQVGRLDNLYVDADHYTAAFSGEIASRIAQYLHDSGLRGTEGSGA